MLGKDMKGFLERQSENFKILLVKKVGNGFIDGFVGQYTSLYQRALGADLFQLGFLSSIGRFISGIMSIPLGWLLDRYSLRKMMLVGMIIEVFVPLFYALSWDWVLLIPTVILSSVVMTEASSIFNIYLANSLKDRDRASGFGVTQSLSTIGGLITPVIAAYMMTRTGGVGVESLRPLFYIQVIGLILLSIVVFWKLKEEKLAPPNQRTTLHSFFRDFSQIFKENQGLKTFVFLDSSNTFMQSLMMPFNMVFATEIKQASPMILGYMVVAFNLFTLLFPFPVGKLADRIGRKKSILLTRPVMYAYILIFVFAPTPAWLILAWALAGFPYQWVLWSTLTMEMVPREMRGRWTGLLAFIRGFTTILAPIVGAWLWETYGASTPFLFAIAFDLLIRMPIFARIPKR